MSNEINFEIEVKVSKEAEISLYKYQAPLLGPIHFVICLGSPKYVPDLTIDFENKETLENFINIISKQYKELVDKHD